MKDFETIEMPYLFLKALMSDLDTKSKEYKYV